MGIGSWGHGFLLNISYAGLDPFIKDFIHFICVIKDTTLLYNFMIKIDTLKHRAYLMYSFGLHIAVSTFG